MQNSISAEKIVSVIWKYIDYYRSTASIFDIYPAILYVLYGIHKKYTAGRVPNGQLFFLEENDALLNDLFQLAEERNFQFYLYDLYQDLSSIDYDTYEDYYCSVLGLMNHKVSTSAGKKDGDFFTPEAINILFSLYINGKGLKSVYDPFCGTASLIHWIDVDNSELLYQGQDYSLLATLIARLNVESRLGKDGYIKSANSIEEWNPAQFDAVVSCPPFGLKVMGDSNSQFKSCEEMVFVRGFDINKAHAVVCLTSMGFSFREGNEKKTRKWLVENNLLDTIVSLPANILYGTSVPCLLFVCKSNRPQGETIKFIHAEDYFTGDSKLKRQFDIVRFISSMELKNSNFCVNVSAKQIQDFDYNLNPALYIDKNYKLAEGQKAVRLIDMLKLEEGIRLANNSKGNVIIPAKMKINYIQVLLNKNKTDVMTHIEASHYRLYQPEDGKSYLIVSDMGGDIRFALYDDNKPFFCSTPVKVFSVNSTVVNPDYLVYLLTNHSTLRTSRMSIRAFGTFPFVIDSMANQKQIIGRLLRQHADKVKAEYEANERRLGIKSNISDLEHMLGSTQMKINNIIERLTTIKPDSDGYPETVKQLKDNVEYMNRIIHYTNASIDKESFNMKELDFMEYLNQYLSAWSNYGGNYFRLTVSNYVDGEINLKFDKALMTVMLDSILSNAVRHGFHKRKNFTPNNEVNIALSQERYKDKPYLVIRIANNGEPISDEFTIEDYITRGRFSASTGRSGLGGYHVYQIVKGHEGFLSLDSNKVWNVIVEILLPVDYLELNGLIDYEHECI